ncbi:hypothetical protein [Methylobacterium longum]|uniref:Uncharacterized protein n=1 Tax=Methylobacterium longum TaxID=767694 RepID=A0ABT8AXU1_9HYPH|nr:hypothetical protein [Methylobacterium longum]MDN3574638.1 hypothetical protein [Methylobacterium longum]GJE14747.1 hypothetical protein FOHLNKBM_5822 [Methylobacterium longum]
MDEAVQALSEPTHDFWPVPLARMSCALGTAYEPDTGALCCPGGANGFAMYGPYLPVEPGLYEVVIDVELTGQKNPKLYLDLWIEGRVLTKRAVLLDRGHITLRGWVPAASRLEIRAHTVGTGFVIHGISTRRLDPTAEIVPSPAESMKDLRRQQLRTALGVNADEAQEPSLRVEALLDSTFSDPGFLFLDDSEVAAHEIALARGGIQSLAVQLLFARNNTRLMQKSDDLPELMNGYPDISNALQLDMLRDGAMVIPSLFGPGAMTSRVSFPVLSPKSVVNLFYEFDEPHHVIIGVNTSWVGALSFVWFVDLDILIYDASLHWLTDYEPTLPILRRFVTLCAQHSAAARAYREAGKTPTCISGFIANMGHYFWNEVSGLERVLRAGYRPQVLLADARWLPLRDIFSDDGLSIVAEVEPDPDALFLIALNRGLFLVRPTGNAIDATLAAKIERVNRRVLDSQRPGQIADVDVTTEGSFVLFFNLRAHNKSWLEQIEGAVEVVARLKQLDASRRIVLFLDGYADCAEIAAAIRERLAPTCQVIDGTHAPFAETLAWAYRCDLFVAVIGSGLVPLTWLAGKPGVCHGDHRHLDQMSFWPLVRLGYDQLSWPRHEDVVMVEDAWYANYSVPTALIADLAVDQLRKSVEVAARAKNS